MWRLCIETIHIPTRTETVAKQRGMLLQLSANIRINITQLCNYSIHVLISTAVYMQCIAVYVYWIQYIVVYMYLFTGSNTL